MALIRRIQAGDSIPALTDLLHRAYAPLAAQGFRYLATHQDVATTERRLSHGEGYLLWSGEQVLGTLMVIPPLGGPSSCAWYTRPDVALIGQFAVEPAHQRRGLGALLLDHAERRAAELGAREVAIDTAEGAAHLISLYERRGYRFIQHAQWEHTNYRSVVLSKALAVR